MTSAHVAAPHRFPQYFPQDWLRHVQDKDCRVKFEACAPNGSFRTITTITQPLTAGFRHSFLDVAAFVPQKDLADAMHQMAPLTLVSKEEVKIGDPVSIAGFRLTGESGLGTDKVISSHLSGTVSETWESRFFVDTGSIPSEMGMCGGPALRVDDDTACIGLLEGLVPPELIEGEDEKKSSSAHLRGKSVFISSSELMRFLEVLESQLQRDPPHPRTAHRH